MESKELIEYIQSQINNKIPKEEIIKVLKEQGGWVDKDINDAFLVFERNIENQHSAVEKPEEKPEQPEIQAQTFDKKTSNHGLQIIVAVVVLAIISVGGYFGVKHFSAPTDLDEITMDETKKESLENKKVDETLPVITEKEIGGKYVVKGKSVFFDGIKINNADSETFQFVGGHYARDKNYVYYACNSIFNVDLETFEYMGGDYVKDRNHVYFANRIIESADLETFQFVGGANIEGILGVWGWYAKDKNTVYCTRRPFPEEISKKIDVQTFQFVGGYYTKDKNHIYYEKYIVPDADPATFEYIGGLFAKDKNCAYRRTTIIPNADPATFEHVGTGYTKDKNQVYYSDEVLAEANLATFEYLGGVYTKDKKNIYCRNEIISNVDLSTFEYVGGNENSVARYTKDKNHVYYSDKILTKADPATFEYVGGNYTKDKNNVYLFGFEYKPEIIKGADPATFIYTYHNSAKDKKNVYFLDRAIPDADPKSFELVHFFIGKDINNLYLLFAQEEIKVIKIADPETFKFIGVSDSIFYVFYTKDKNYVYEYSFDEYGYEKRVTGADPANCTAENLDGCKAPTE